MSDTTNPHAPSPRPRRRVPIRGRWWSIVLAMVLIAGTLSIPAFAHHRPDHGSGPGPDDGPKAFTAEFSLAGLGAANGDIEIELVVTNQSQDQNLGSAEVFPPEGVSFGGAVEGPDVGRAFIEDGVLKLRDLELPPTESATVTFTVDACSSDEWTIVAKQSNDFKGTGNDIPLDEDGSTLSVDCDVATCDDEECSVTLEGANMQLEFGGTLKQGETSGTLIVELRDHEEIDCGTEHGLDSDVESFFFDVSGLASPVEMTMTVKADDGTFTPRSASDYQLCWLGEAPFIDADGNEVEENPVGDDFEGSYGPALAQGCPAEPEGGYGELDAIQFPCGLAWVNEPDGTRTVRYLLPADDPIGAWK